MMKQVIEKNYSVRRSVFIGEDGRRLASVWQFAYVRDWRLGKHQLVWGEPGISWQNKAGASIQDAIELSNALHECATICAEWKCEVGKAAEK
jgi:hypothetical protein